MHLMTMSAAAMTLAFAASSGSAAAGCGGGEIDRWSQKAQSEYASARYGAAASSFLAGAKWAETCDEPRRRIRFLNGAAGALFASYRYRDSLKLYLQTQQLAESLGDDEVVAVTAFNLSSLYTFLWEPAAAEASLQKAAARMPAGSPYGPNLYAQRMLVAARRGNLEKAFEFGLRAAELADRAGNTALQTLVWDKLGRLELEQGRQAEGEEYLLASFRVRKLQKLPLLESSYRSLSRLRLAQGRAAEALVLARAAELTRETSPSLAAEWTGHYYLGLALEANGMTGAALDEYQRGLMQAREWRSGLLPAQWMLSAADVGESQIAAAYAMAAAAESEKSGDPVLAKRALEAVETSRASSLRSLALDAAWRHEKLPAEFSEVLAALRDAEFRHLKGDEAAARRAEELKGKLAQLEARLDRATQTTAPAGESNADSMLPAPKPGECRFSFLIGEARSWVWALSEKGLTSRVLPGREELRLRIRSFTEAVRQDSKPAARLGRELFDILFGWSGEDFAGQPVWTLSLDDALFELPFGALRDSLSNGLYVAQHHTITITPSFAYEPAGYSGLRPGRVVAVGDCIYNEADPRCRRGWLARLPWPEIIHRVRASGAEGAMELPRLAGSAAEIRTISETFQRPGVPVHVLSGAEATSDAVQAALTKETSVVHLAVHVVSGTPGGAEFQILPGPGETGKARRPDEVFIALSMGPNRRPGLLAASTIAGMIRLPGALVVISGCSSGRGLVLPGAGLQGLTHAWLAAGAANVVGSLWQVTDDSGELFGVFYRRLSAGDGAAAALRAAQTAMIESGGWKSRPAYWAAYSLTGKS